MATEIERKFLINGNIPKGNDTRISQAYLSVDPERTIRVRIEDKIATINIKTQPLDAKESSITRNEYEYEIPFDDAKELFHSAVGSTIEKTRTVIHIGKLKWEVDTFHGENQGLIVAEVELHSEDQKIDKPDWIGEEVSHLRQYANFKLTQQPFSQW